MTQPDGQALHDRLTQGQQLTTEEQVHLDAWYQAQDQAESHLLDQQLVSTDVSILRTQLAIALKQLVLVSQHINDVIAVNDDLRRDIARLQGQLVPYVHGHAA
jgi:hypothetical protein